MARRNAMVVKIDQERFIGIRHRRKRTADGEARSTQVAIITARRKKPLKYKLETDDEELDFALGRFPTKRRKPAEDEDLSNFADHHIKWRPLTKKEKPKDFPKKVPHLATKVPAAYDGLQPGDVVGMVLGGSGDLFAFALSRRGEDIEADVFRIPPFTLKDLRTRDKEHDAENLAELVRNQPEMFQRVEIRDRELINLRQLYKLRQDAMKGRIATEQRMYLASSGQIFCREDGLFPEGSIAAAYLEEKASDEILKGMEADEERRKDNLIKAIKQLDVYREVFAPVTGIGPMIAARMIVSIQDIRRFQDHFDSTGKKHAGNAKLKAYCGAFVKKGGKYGDRPFERQFPRQRRGKPSNWSGEARQGLYLLVKEQFVRQKDRTRWGRLLLEYKARLRAKYPEPVEVEKADGKKVKRYTDGHIHKMAIWKTASKFVEWLYKEWWAFENKVVALQRRKAA
jgi:hypothetical protein